MGASVHTWSAVLLVAAGLAVGCASGPSLPRAWTIEPGQRTTVSLTQVQGRMVLRLLNESSGDAEDVYSDQKSDPLAKVVADAQLQALLDVFAAQGMTAHNRSTVPPEARDVLAVEQGGRRWLWVRQKAGLEAEAAFHEAKAYFLDVYNSSTAYHGARGERPDLRSEKERASEDAAAARRKLEALRDKEKTR